MASSQSKLLSKVISGTVVTAGVAGTLYILWKKRSKDPNDSDPGTVDKKIAYDVEAQMSNTDAGQPCFNNFRTKPEFLIENDYDHVSESLKLPVPLDHVPALIGKKGGNIKSIEASTNTRIFFEDKPATGNHRICVIRGYKTNVALAKSSIIKYLENRPKLERLSMLVPTWAVGRIIGVRGDNIRNIRDRTKCYVDVQKHSVVLNSKPPSCEVVWFETFPCEANQILIKGTKHQIGLAKSIIVTIVNDTLDMRKESKLRFSCQQRVNAGICLLNARSKCEEPVEFRLNSEFEVYVSCVYHPNSFYFQIVGREGIELDRMCESLTAWYKEAHSEQSYFLIGDVVATPFEVDQKIYRGKILSIEGDRATVVYLDYGDKRDVPLTLLKSLDVRYLSLRYQAIKASLNLVNDQEDDSWTPESIEKFCSLSSCGRWMPLNCKVQEILDETEGQGSILCVELFDKDRTISEELIRLGLAKPVEVKRSGSRKTSLVVVNHSPIGSQGIEDEEWRKIKGKEEDILSRETFLNSETPSIPNVPSKDNDEKNNAFFQ